MRRLLLLLSPAVVMIVICANNTPPPIHVTPGTLRTGGTLGIFGTGGTPGIFGTGGTPGTLETTGTLGTTETLVGTPPTMTGTLGTTETLVGTPPTMTNCSGNSSSLSRMTIGNLKPAFNFSFFVSLGEDSEERDVSLIHVRKSLNNESMISLTIKANTVKLSYSTVDLQSRVPTQTSCFFVSVSQLFWDDKVLSAHQFPQINSLRPFYFSSSRSFI